MTKKAKRSKKSAKTRAAKEWSSEEILDMWDKAAKSGLGAGKKFHTDIATEYGPRLLAAILKHLTGPPPTPFNKKAEIATKTVARDLGRICRMLTGDKKTVIKDTFDAVFDFVQTSHPACPGAGGGEWCDIGG